MPIFATGLEDCLAKFDYTAQGPTELTLREGDKIHNVEVTGEEWFKGTLREKTGLLPEKFLKLRTWSISKELLSTLGLFKL